MTSILLQVLCALALGAAVSAVAPDAVAGRTPALAGAARDDPAGVWIAPPGDTAGVALALPGLNLKPEKMSDAARLLTDHGVAVLVGGLAGGSGGREELYGVTADTWVSDFLALYDRVNGEADRLEVPLYFVGHSLGCLVALNAMARHERVAFDRLVLFAPAVTPRPVAGAVRLIGKKTIIPSRTPEEYRVHDGLPASAYHALLELAGRLRDSGYRGIDVPALVFIDRKDELVDYRCLARLAQNRLPRWRVVVVDNGKSSLSRPFHHLIIDEDSVGIEQWGSMREEIAGFLR
jgi:pimeloyl-ACP methyl ester carboxylesterase